MNTCPENVAIIEPFLKKVIQERLHSSIVIHESVEALGNIAEENLTEVLA